MKRKKSKYWTRKYDPLYTWNRGGRLKEIRKRHLARKFFLHWKTKVWGGTLIRVITPEKADEFRKRSLLKKAFIAYKTIWWENNKEWKLDLKAKVCHEKYLQRQALEYWKDFLAYQRYLKILEERAYEFNKHNLRKKFVGKIVIGAYASRQTKELQYQASRYMELSCVRTALLQWRNKLLLIQTAKEARDIYSVKFSLYKWRCQLLEKISNKNKILATQSRLKLLKKKQVVHSWQNQIQKEMILRMHSAKLSEMINYNLVKKAVRSWRKERHREQDRNYILSIAMNNNLENRLVLREFLSIWVKKTNLRRCLNSLQTIQKNYALNLSLQIWRRKTKLSRKAASFRKDKLIDLALQKWESKLSQKEDIAILPALEIAERFYESKLVLQFWGAWQNFILSRKQVKAMEETALAFCNLNLKGKFVSIWQDRFSEKQRYNELLRNAYVYRTNVLLAKVSYGIWNGSIRSKDMREKTEEAKSFCNLNLNRRVLQTWKQCYDKKLAENHRLLAAQEYYESKLKRQSFSAIFAYNYEIKQENERIIWARNVYKSNLASSVVNSWFIELQVASFVRKNRRKLLKKLFLTWQAEIEEIRKKTIRADDFRKNIEQKTLAYALSKWKTFTRISIGRKKRVRDNIVLAKRTDENRLITGCLNLWKTRFTSEIFSRERCDEIFNKNQEAIEQIAIRHRFRHIMQILKDIASRRLRTIAMSERAVDFRHRHLISGILVKVKASHDQAEHRNKLSKIASNFVEIRIVTYSLATWKRKHQEKIDENRKTAKALQFWYEGLIWKFLKYWKIWKSNQDKKKEFYDDAFARYRKSVETGWIKKLKEFNSKIEQESLQKARSVLSEREIILAKRVLKRWKAKCCPRLSEMPVFATISLPEIPISRAVYDALPITEDVKLEQKLFQVPRIPMFLQEELVSIITEENIVIHENDSPQEEGAPKLLGPNAFGDAQENNSFPIYHLKSPQKEKPQPVTADNMEEKENFPKLSFKLENKFPDPSALYLLKPQTKPQKDESPFPFSPMFSESSSDFPDTDDPLMDKEKRSWRFGQDRKPINAFLIIPERQRGDESWGTEHSDTWSCLGSSRTSSATTPAITLDDDVPLEPYVVPEFDDSDTEGLPSRPTSPPKPKALPRAKMESPKITEKERQDIIMEMLELTRLQEKLAENDPYSESVSFRMQYLHTKLQS